MVTELEWSRFEQPSEAVISGVAAVSATPPDELDPLYDYIDPDALNSLFDSESSNDDILHKELRFQYSGCLVIAKDDRLVISELNITRAS